MKNQSDEKLEKIIKPLEAEAEKEARESELKTKVFPHLSIEELTDILGLTVKRDGVNKLVTFLCFLSAFTEDSQFNISFNAPSSAGKSYIPIELSHLFPDVIKIGYSSPTAFFHDHGQFDKELNGYVVDLERKILVFLDQPHMLLLQHLRPLLSHDEKEIRLKITDKSQKYGIKTKTILLRGFPSVVFCSAGLKTDEQELTRFILLSPETTQEKIREAIELAVRKEADREGYYSWLEGDERRKLLKQRVEAIELAGVKDVKIPQEEEVKERFFAQHKPLKPRHQRDIKRICSLIKSSALLNLWNRERAGDSIVADSEDVETAFGLWGEISVCQEYGVPPYYWRLFKEVIVAACEGNEFGVSRQEIIRKHFEVYGRPLADWFLRQEIIPMLDSAGLITREADPLDKRRELILPAKLGNSESDGGVGGENQAEEPGNSSLFPSGGNGKDGR